MKCYYCQKECEGFAFEQGDFMVFAHRDCAVKQVETHRDLTKEIEKVERLEAIKKGLPLIGLKGKLKEDIEWAIEQAEKVEELERLLEKERNMIDWLVKKLDEDVNAVKKLEWLKGAIEVCNEQELTPKKLAELLKQVNA